MNIKSSFALPTLAVMVCGGLAQLGACSASGDTAVSPPPATMPDGGKVTPTADSGAPPPPPPSDRGDGGVTAISVQPDITCDPGNPTSCCYARQKYGGRLGADKTCGPNGDEDCCAYDDIPGGTFNRGNDAAFPATLPNYKLGRYLVTTARFKVWMEEGGGLQANAPAVGAGAHPSFPDSGWKAAYNDYLAVTPSDLKLKVYRDPGADGWGCTLDYYEDHPNYPTNCIDWYVMQAFCAWDGGYAITEAQWEYAAHGGSEQRTYPWGNTKSTALSTSVTCLEGGGTWGIDMWCNNPTNPVPKDVGWAKDGKGKYGTYDLVGNLMNMVRDESPNPIAAYPMPCTNDCLPSFGSDGGTVPTRTIARGIEFGLPMNLGPTAYNDLGIKRIVTVRKTFNGEFYGFRCAYPNSWPASK